MYLRKRSYCRVKLNRCSKSYAQAENGLYIVFFGRVDLGYVSVLSQIKQLVVCNFVRRNFLFI